MTPDSKPLRKFGAALIRRPVREGREAAERGDLGLVKQEGRG